MFLWSRVDCNTGLCIVSIADFHIRGKHFLHAGPLFPECMAGNGQLECNAVFLTDNACLAR
jgi:hypothetical protein